MKTTQLRHLASREVATSGVLHGVKAYGGMVNAIIKHGKSLGESGSEKYNDFVGAAFEVYTEFFFTRYGTTANPQLNVLHVEDTSTNKFEAGIDFRYTDFNGQPAVIQSKFRSNHIDRFTRGQLGSFISVADEENIAKKNRILFTTLEHHSPEDGIFDYSWPKGHTQMRVIGKNHQEEFIDRDPTFWQELANSLDLALQAPCNFKTPPSFWAHQDRMNQGVQPVLQNGGRGRVICATGGGKTRVIFQNVMDGFAAGFNTQVVVAPTIDLLRQHHEFFNQYGVFHEANAVSVIHFRTGEESRDAWADIKQTTSVVDVLEWKTAKTLIFVTYASEGKLFTGLKSKSFMVDAVYWDEFHHTVQQTSEQKAHLMNLPSHRNLFYSASIKRGRIVDANDEELFGPLLAEVTYAELRKAGILVPKIKIKTVFINDTKIKHLEKAMKKAAKRENFDLKTAVIEAAGTIAAYRNMRQLNKKSNVVTFSKSVAICKEIVSNDLIKGEFNCLVNTVHAEVPGHERRKIYEAVKTAENSVLCQYSVVKEGIDINPFNCVVFSRGMDVIGTQQAIGRIVRANPQDTINLQAGKISLDSPEGWLKYEATVFIIMHNDDAATFKDFLKEMVSKLQFSGFEPDDYEFSDVSEDRHGIKDDEESWIKPFDQVHNLLGIESVRDAVNRAVIAEENENDYHALLQTSTNLSELELLK